MPVPPTLAAFLMVPWFLAVTDAGLPQGEVGDGGVGGDHVGGGVGGRGEELGVDPAGCGAVGDLGEGAGGDAADLQTAFFLATATMSAFEAGGLAEIDVDRGDLLAGRSGGDCCGCLLVGLHGRGGDVAGGGGVGDGQPAGLRSGLGRRRERPWRRCRGRRRWQRGRRAPRRRPRRCRSWLQRPRGRRRSGPAVTREAVTTSQVRVARVAASAFFTIRRFLSGRPPLRMKLRQGKGLPRDSRHTRHHCLRCHEL